MKNNTETEFNIRGDFTVKEFRNENTETREERIVKINQANDKGNISSRELGEYGGNIGGEMTKRLIEIGQKQLINKKS